MQFSRYVHGQGTFGGGEPNGRKIYEDALRNYGVEENFPDDENTKGELYADAMAASAVRVAIRRMVAEVHPLSAQTMLETHEFETGAVPLAGESCSVRRRRVYELRRLRLDGRWSSIYAALNSLLGSKLAFYRTVRVDELQAWEKERQDWENWTGHKYPKRVLRTLAPIVHLGKAQPIPVEYVAGSETPLYRGAYMLINPGHSHRAERVYVARESNGTLSATFFKPHDKGSIITSGHHPRFVSTKRTHIIALTDEWSLDPSTRTTIDQLMRRMVKGTAQWRILRATSASECAGFVVGTSPVGVTPVSAVAA